MPERVICPVDYSPSDEVIVQKDLLAGLKGVVQQRRSGGQLVIWVREIGSGVAFTIGFATVSRCLTARP